MSDESEYYGIELEAWMVTDPIWTTKDGQRLHVSEMTDSHLLNTIRFIGRNAFAFQMRDAFELWNGAESTNGEMASYSLEQEGERIAEMSDWEYLEHHEVYQAMLREAKRRGLEAGER